MSNIVNNYDENEKKEAILPNVKVENDLSKRKLILLYSLTIGGMLLTIVIVFLISSHLGNSKKEYNIISLKFKPNSEAETQLFNSKYIN